MHFVKDVDTMLKNPFEGSKAKYRIIGSFVVFVIIINGILMALEDNYGISKRSNAQLMDFYPERMGERYVYEEKNNRRLGDLQAHELVRLENDAKAIIDIKRKMIAESEASKQ